MLRTDGWTHGQRENSLPTKTYFGGGYNKSIKSSSVQRVITFRPIEIFHVSTCVFVE